jgi:type II secretory ATPase GspE/PulE/Tfp pilus assembly ATPase PilB-like protein
MPDGLRVRYRIDGVLRDITTMPADLSRKVIVALKVMSKMDISKADAPRRADWGKICFQWRGRTRNGYASQYPACVNGEKAVIRLLPRKTPTSKIRLHRENAAGLQNLVAAAPGMIILTGPTGSGKTSTLYTSLQTVAKER